MISPEFLAGVIEGFYGRPWSPEQRHLLFGWLQQAGLNTYFYAPKDDLKHRALWRAPYEAAETDALTALIADCHAHGLRFFYGLAPGLDIQFTNPTDQQALQDKLTAMARLGVDGLALLFDDIPGTLTPADAALYPTPAAAQADLANSILGVVIRQHPNLRLLFCPTVYCGRMAEPDVTGNACLQELGRRLDPPIGILWTGPHIISESIPPESIAEVTAVLRRPPVIWDNLLANDYDHRQLFLGPFSGRDPVLRERVAGILLNPNCPFEANYVGIHTLGQYLRVDPPPPPAVAHRRALEAWLPEFEPAVGKPITLEELEFFTGFLHLPAAPGPAGTRFLEDLDVIRSRPAAEWGGAATRLQAACAQLERVYDQLTRLANRPLLHALHPQAWELKEQAQLVRQWIDWKRRHPGADARFASPDFRPGIVRGSFAALLERRLPLAGIE